MSAGRCAALPGSGLVKTASALSVMHGITCRAVDGATTLNFRHLPEWRGLTGAFFAEVNRHLGDKGITLRAGTIVDATIIDAPSPAKNKAGRVIPIWHRQ
jgi:hypothetical protein